MTGDAIADGGYVFLGSRLKRLAEQMQGDVSRVSERAGIAIPPGKYPLLVILADQGPQTVSELARVMGLSQPMTTRSIAKLAELGLVQADRSQEDGRNRIVSLTPAGAQAVARSRAIVWPLVEAAVRQVADGLPGSLLDQIGAIERALAERSLADRAAAGALVPAGDADVPAIVALMNRAYRGGGAEPGWTTETAYIAGDRITAPLLRADLAAKPDASLLMWRDAEDGALTGCVWIEPCGDHSWYLGSLTVDPARQQGGFGRALLASAEQAIRDRGGRRARMTVVNVRDALIAWYLRRGYALTGETSPFPYDDTRFGTPLRDDLRFVILEKDLMPAV